MMLVSNQISLLCTTFLHRIMVQDYGMLTSLKTMLNFLIHMEGLRFKRVSNDFSPLSELKTLAQVLLQTLDNTMVYTLTNIDRDPSLKPNIRGIRGI